VCARGDQTCAKEVEHRHVSYLIQSTPRGDDVAERCRYLFPLAERLLWFSSALSSFPGQVPTQEVNSAAEENVLASTPTSAIICCAESTPNPGTSTANHSFATPVRLVPPLGDYLCNVCAQIPMSVLPSG
jgi:hypothetical protein